MPVSELGVFHLAIIGEVFNGNPITRLGRMLRGDLAQVTIIPPEERMETVSVDLDLDLVVVKVGIDGVCSLFQCERIARHCQEAGISCLIWLRREDDWAVALADLFQKYHGWKTIPDDQPVSGRNWPSVWITFGDTARVADLAITIVAQR